MLTNMPCKASLYHATVSSLHVRPSHLSIIAAHQPQLWETLDAGHNLEGYTDAEKTSLPDVGYTALGNGSNAAKVPPKKCT